MQSIEYQTALVADKVLEQVIIQNSFRVQVRIVVVGNS